MKEGLTIKRLLLFPVLILTGMICVFFTLNLLDSLVQDTLYNYGLQFSYDWANPYWMTLRIVQALLGLSMVLTLINTVYVLKRHGLEVFRMPKIGLKPKILNIEETKTPKIGFKKPKIEITPTEKSTASSTIGRQFSDIPSNMFKCGHCEKIFAQPLRMLDFHQDRPKIVNICPFCNEIIYTASRKEEPKNFKR
jgi:hypothetical protein